jgi:membrane protease YdiL (CAAX protease family)
VRPSCAFALLEVLAVFALVHVTYRSWSWGLLSFATGSLFGVMREKTGSAVPGAVAHGLADVRGSVPQYLSAG